MHFVSLFNQTLFWESHEVLEIPWRLDKSAFYQGLILFASGYVHAQRGNPVGVRKQMQKANRRLNGFPDAYLGIDVAAVRTEIKRCLNVVQQHGAPEGPQLAEQLGFITLSLAPQRLRGDEPELADARGASPEATT